MNREYSPLLLETFQEAREIICKWATKNIQDLSSEKLALYVRNELLHYLFNQFKEEINDEELTIDDFKEIMKIQEFGVTTTWRYLRHLGFKFSEHKKTYYNDKHESEENVSYRKKIIRKYFDYELLSYLWVQLTDEEAIELENDHDDPLLPDSYAYRENGVREYHIDMHSKFKERELCLLVI